jgi:hypothetical protein
MSWKVRGGLLLLIVLSMVWITHHQTSVTPPPVREEAEVVLEERRPHATWAEKRENKRIARAYAQAGWGWDGREWECLKYLWSSESRFDHYADNPESTAFGIAQRLGERSKNPRIQILKGLRYVAHRYDTPCRAWSHWLKKYHY